MCKLKVYDDYVIEAHYLITYDVFGQLVTPTDNFGLGLSDVENRLIIYCQQKMHGHIEMVWLKINSIR